jgi:signal transduction histidine kinase
MADRSAALLVELLGSETSRSGANLLAKVLQADPPLVVWLGYWAGRYRPGWRPRSLTELAQWVETRLVDLFAAGASPTPLSPLPTGPEGLRLEGLPSGSEGTGSVPSPPWWGGNWVGGEERKDIGTLGRGVPSASKTSEFHRQVVRDLFRAHFGLHLAGRTSPAHPGLAEQVYLVGLIAEADRWVRLGTDHPEPNLRGFFPDWLTESEGPVRRIVEKAKIWSDRLLPPVGDAPFLADSAFPAKGAEKAPGGEVSSTRVSDAPPTPGFSVRCSMGVSPTRVSDAQGAGKDSDQSEGFKGVGLSDFSELRDCIPAYQQAFREATQWAESLPGLPENVPQLLCRLARAQRWEAHFAETLEQAKLEALAELAAGAAHEINNPLAVIAGRAQLLLQQATDPEQRRALAVILAQVRRTYEMIADLHLFARPPQPQLQRVDLVGLVNRLLEEFQPTAEEQGVRLCWSGHPGPLEIQADPVQIQAALRAVVQNGLEAVGRGGQVQVVLHTHAEWVSVRVQDNGPGIPPIVRAHLFDPFFSGRSAGRGLGLGLSKAWRIVVGNHQGHIRVQSTPGQGTCIELLLPKTKSDPPTPFGSEGGPEWVNP